MRAFFREIPAYDSFVKIEPVNKGWSSDKKYYIETAAGEKLLLRVADIVEYERKKNELDVMKRISALGINMSQPLDCGTCNSGANVYTLLTWCEGEEAKTLLPALAETEQYALGLKAGGILKSIHTIEPYPKSSEWAKSYGGKIDGYIEKYKNCGMTFDGDKTMLDYIKQNRHLINNRPMCLTHGDFHAGNLVISPEKELYVIDFQRYRIIDPYCALMSIMFSADVSPHFATGQLRGYFDGEPPEDFWELLAFYLAAVSINAIPWSIPFGQEEIDFSYKMIENILHWFDHMKNPVPTWYLKDFYVHG
jgi:serine/threonine-protein kinase